MAHILPETPPGFLPKEVHKTFKALKRLPDDFFIWHHLAPWEPNSPDFLIIDRDGRSLLVKVSAATDYDAIPASQFQLLGEERPNLGEQEALVLENFVNTVDIPSESPLETLVIFPNIPHKAVTQSRIERQPGEPQWAGRELLLDETGDLWAAYFPPEPLDKVTITRIRQRFTPEIIVPQELTTRTPQPEKIDAGLTDFLLDYDQEKALKADLELDTEGTHLTDNFRLNIINGVAGSGKTLILLYRLRLLYHLYPEKQFLVLTHNKPLRKDLESRFRRLEGTLPENITWQTFYGWCYQNWPKQPAWMRPVSIKKREKIIQRVWEDQLQDTAITPYKLAGEIDWIKDQKPLTRRQYLRADRRGRGFGLNSDQRQRMWEAYVSYQSHLEQNRLCDWGDIPQHLWQFVNDKEIILPRYDAILVDETQFFAPLWIDLVRQSLKSANAHLLFVADPTQGFLGRRTTWKSVGVEARGRTHLLRKSYRTTQEIMQFATLFYRLRLPDEKDDDILAPNMLEMPTGAFPQMIPLSSPQDEIARVANEVEAFLKSGYPRRDIYVLHANYQGAAALIQAINRRLGKDAAMEPRDSYPGNYVRVTTISAGAGLESPIVFLVGLRDLFEREQSLRLGDDEREEIIQNNTRKIFMAATRAGQRLVFTYVGELPEALEKVFGERAGGKNYLEN